jgi:LysM repeat protein
MVRHFLALILCLMQLPVVSWAQKQLKVVNLNHKPFVEHKIADNQTIFTLSRMYHISLAEIADANNALYKKGFSNGDIVYIPITKSNYLQDSVANSLPLEYKVKDNETLLILSKWMNVRQSMIQTWNDLPNPLVRNGQNIIIGWLKYASQNNTNSNSKFVKPSSIEDEIIEDKDVHLAPKVVNTLELNYSSNVGIENQENGLVVFYTNKSLINSDTYYAFHNQLGKGTIVKVTNPVSQKSIYAKIIGEIPKLPEYSNAKLVLSDNAVPALQAESKEFFCNIFYK